jgi:F-type H+-transporting ATPase subunit gamma
MAGAGVREFKRRIRSVKNTQQITKAMKMVAAAKLRQSSGECRSSPTLYRDSAGYTGQIGQPFLSMSSTLSWKKRGCTQVGYIVVTADRGLMRSL